MLIFQIFSNLLKSNLAIPDAYCDPFASESDNQCPKNMKCVRTVARIADEGSYASFEAFRKFFMRPRLEQGCQKNFFNSVVYRKVNYYILFGG